MATSFLPFNHPWLGGLFRDAEAARLVGSKADMAAMLRFEAALAAAQADCGLIARESADGIGTALASFRPDLDALAAGTRRDGVVVPELVRQLRDAVGAPWSSDVHLGVTSQDVVDTALALRLKDVFGLLEGRIAALSAAFAELDRRLGATRWSGVTRMQPAIPIRASDRIASWAGPVGRAADDLAALRPRVLVVQFGGAAGTLEAFGADGPRLRARLAERLGLADAPQWHSQRDGIAAFAGLLARLGAACGKFGQDVALMALVGTDVSLAGGGGSSAMPHKCNPVAAEILVTLARFNATLVSGIHGAGIHEMERSGAAWSLEWLLLPQMVVATATALARASELAGQIEAG